MAYPVFDLHCDTADRLAWHTLPREHKDVLGNEAYGPDDARDPAETNRLARNRCHISLERIGDTPWAQCFACFIPDSLDPAQSLAFYRHVDRYLAAQLDETAPRAVPADGAASIRPALEAGGVVAIRTVENARLFAHDPDLVGALADSGVLMASLSWNAPGPLASGHDDEDRGLTPLGADVLSRMEESRMVLDVSHLNDRSFADVERRATRPFIASHSNSRAVCGHPRNLTDEQFACIRDRGGIVGLNYCVSFLRDGARTAGDVSFDDIARHIEHWLDEGGENVIALGSDFDGCDTPACIETASQMPAFQALLESRFGAEITRKICSENALSFFERWAR